MKEVFVKDLRKDQEITDFFMAKTLAIKVGANGRASRYSAGRQDGRNFRQKERDVSDAEYPVLKAIGEKSIVKIKAVVTEWAGQLQLRVQRIRAAALDDGQHMEDFVKAAPEVPEDMFGYIYETAGSMKDQDLKKLCIKLLTDNREKLMYYPAAQKNHHAELAGLLYHMKRMLMTGEEKSAKYTQTLTETCYVPEL